MTLAHCHKQCKLKVAWDLRWWERARYIAVYRVALFVHKCMKIADAAAVAAARQQPRWGWVLICNNNKNNNNNNIERETTKSGLQEHGNTSESTDKALEHEGTQEHCNRPGMQRSTGRPQEHCRAQLKHGLITDRTLIEHEVSRNWKLGALREH
jgi:hypothetical protein